MSCLSRLKVRSHWMLCHVAHCLVSCKCLLTYVTWCGILRHDVQCCVAVHPVWYGLCQFWSLYLMTMVWTYLKWLWCERTLTLVFDLTHNVRKWDMCDHSCCCCMCGRFLMQVLQLIVTELSGRSFHWLSATSNTVSSCHFLCQELSHLLLYITHMFQSGICLVLLTSAYFSFMYVSW